MKKKVLSITLVAAILVSMFSIGIFSVSASGAKIIKNHISFKQTGTGTDNVPAGTDKAAYIAEKKAQFDNEVNFQAGANGDIDNYSKLFTSNTYAVVDKVRYVSRTYEESDDAMVIGDYDDWENLWVVSGWIAKVNNYCIDYKLITVGEGEAPQHGGVIERVELTPEQPEGGTTSANYSPQVDIDAEHCSVVSAYWLDNKTNDDKYANRTSNAYLQFEAGKFYYILLTIKADDGYTFEKSGNVVAEGNDAGYDNFNGCIANYSTAFFAGSKTTDGTDYLKVRMSVQASGYVPANNYLYVVKTEGGNFTVEFDSYTNDSQPYRIPESEEVTLTAVAENGYTFKGWYPGNEDAETDKDKYYGLPVSTDSVFTTTLTNERTTYCAVFKKDDAKLIGDANGDGNVDVLDAATIQKHAAGKADLTDEQKYVADVNNDNSVDVLDAAEIQKYSVGKITEFKKKA